MAGLAIHASGVLSRYDLGETLWFCCASLMAPDAQIGSFRQNRFHAWIFGVSGLCPMASFATNSVMRSGGNLVMFFRMAGLAHILTCKRNLLGADIVEGWTTVVAVLAKSKGHGPVTESEKGGYQPRLEPPIGVSEQRP